MKGENIPTAEGQHESKEPAWKGWIRRLLNMNMNMIKMSFLSTPPHLKGCGGLIAAQRKVTEMSRSW